jgi:short-subunit dehydrogenase
MKVKLDGASVLLTGASSGIGRELALLLAPRAKAIALTARRADKLQSLAAELRAINPQLEVKVLPCDLSVLDETEQLCDRVERELGAVDVLINNAGVGDFCLYDQADWPRTRSMITLDVQSLALITRRFVGGMVARGAGGVLNVGSGQGLGVTPGFAAYIGSKHFVTGFTEGLRLDLAGTGVGVTLVCPGPVASEFAGRVGYGAFGDPVPGFAYQSAKACARAALRGLERGRALVVPGWVMKLLYVLIAISPRFLRRWAMTPFGKIARKKLARPADGAGRVLPGP